jgi:hypothetical protein
MSVVNLKGETHLDPLSGFSVRFRAARRNRIDRYMVCF